MRVWESPTQYFPYTFEQVAAAFWDRYPNSKAQHVLSEDVLERKVEGDEIKTKKLIVKKGATFLKAAPRWMARLTSIQAVPTLEESIYNRATRTLTTYTRNISWTSLFHMHERCIYSPWETIRALHEQQSSYPHRTSLTRSVFVSVSYGHIDSLIERVLLMSFRKSTKKTAAGLSEVLTERFGAPLMATTAQTASMSQKAANLKEKILSNKNIGFEKA